MKIIVCVDNQNGMMFNHRRQSQDRVLRKRILELTGGKKLWMNAYSQKQFLQVNGNMPKEQEQSGQLGQSGQIQADEEFLEKAGPGEYCFVEDKDVVPYESRIEDMRGRLQRLFCINGTGIIRQICILRWIWAAGSWQKRRNMRVPRMRKSQKSGMCAGKKYT